MNPSVCCVMLTKNRPQMAARAIRCFQAQAYEKKDLLIYNTEELEGNSIGVLRNMAAACVDADIIIHWDDDDWSHPKRIARQVRSLLKGGGANCAGYRDMLFWDSRGEGEVWHYCQSHQSFALGTSLCYWRTVWERHPFPDLPKPGGAAGEDTAWLAGVKLRAESGFAVDATPLMIAGIHGGNTSVAYRRDVMEAVERQGGEWKRVPIWNDYCRERMAL
jgi:glycosyltransferase involved in cell wall biosynthesis